MVKARYRGTPQGGVISPILSNLFLHYAFDLWMTRTHPDLPWCRYADDGLVHCRTELEAEAIKASLQSRLSECQLELHPTKTRIVYCKVNERRGVYPNVTFDFLGYCFRPRRVMQPSDRKVVGGFTPAVSPTAMKAMYATIRDLNIRRSTQDTLADIARKSIRSFGDGLRTTDATRLLPCTLCTGTSIRRYWRGCNGSSSASRSTRFGRLLFLRSSCERIPNSSCTGGLHVIGGSA